MRLLKVDTNGSFSLKHFCPKDVPRYAILSHTWEADDQEVTFKDMVNGVPSSKSGYRKIQFCGEQAVRVGLQYFWYQNAVKCYVYLSDVSTGKHSRSPGRLWESTFRKSRWFNRGWTLPELLAPRLVEFFSRDGKRLGDKESLESQIHEVTGIPSEALQGRALSPFTIDERMSWAAKRQTTVEEDQAYCLLGLFDVHLPLIHGEGAKNALNRLRRHLQDQSQDQGCGKSVLSKFLVDKELGASESRLTCYFFFKDDSDEQKSVATALSAILHQLFSQKPSLVHHALPDYDANGDKLSQLFPKLWDILTKATADPNAGEVVCILDALDEGEESGRYDIIKALSSLYQQANRSEHDKSKLKFLVTSRPYIDIEHRFAHLTQNIPTIRLKAEKESKAISTEIEIVIEQRVSALALELGLADSEKSDLETELMSMEHRTYLWVHLIFEMLRERIGFTNKKLKELARTLPSTVDQAYEAILSKARNKKKAQKLLHIIVAARRPLTLSEMNIVLAIEDQHLSCDDLDLENEARFETTVRNLCGLFVSVIDRKLYLIHQTAKEFLVAKNDTVACGWKYSLNTVELELVVARTCIAYLMFTVFDKDSSTAPIDENVVKELVKRHGYPSYATSFWDDHYQKAQTRAANELLEMVLQVCDPQSLGFSIWYRVRQRKRYLLGLDPQFSNRTQVAARFGHATVIRQLLATGEVDVDSKNFFYRTPLIYAAERGQEAVVKILLETDKVDADSKDYFDRTPLSYAAEGGHEGVVKLLLATGKVDPYDEDIYGHKALWYALYGGHESVARLLHSWSSAVAQSPGGMLSRCV